MNKSDIRSRSFSVDGIDDGDLDKVISLLNKAKLDIAALGGDPFDLRLELSTDYDSHSITTKVVYRSNITEEEVKQNNKLEFNRREIRRNTYLQLKEEFENECG